MPSSARTPGQLCLRDRELDRRPKTAQSCQCGKRTMVDGMESIDSRRSQVRGSRTLADFPESSDKRERQYTILHGVKLRFGPRPNAVPCQEIEAQLAHLPWIWQLRFPIHMNRDGREIMIGSCRSASLQEAHRGLRVSQRSVVVGIPGYCYAGCNSCGTLADLLGRFEMPREIEKALDEVTRRSWGFARKQRQQ